MNRLTDNTESWIPSLFSPNLVSVIIPTYNRGNYLDQAIRSVFAQSYRPIECIVVDDGSTDDTLEIIKPWLECGHEQFSVRFLAQANAGAPAARNTGTRECQGEFIQYLDSDDLLYPRKIEAQVNVFKRFPGIEGVFGDWDIGSSEKRQFVKAYRKRDLITQFLGDRCIHTFSFLMTRHVIQRIGPWDEQLQQNDEIDFHLRGVLSGGKFVYQHTNCGLWLVHEGERISTRLDNSDSRITFFNKWIDCLGSLGELTLPRRKAISNQLFYNALSTNNTDRNLIRDRLSLSWDLYEGRREFQTCKMRVATVLLGKKVALRMWLWRTLDASRKVNHQ